MRKLLYLLLLASVVACKKQHDSITEAPVLHKIEWHVHAAANYTEPWLDATTARVTIRMDKTDTLANKTATIWDTTFTSRTLRHYPVLPQKHIIEAGATFKK